MTRQGAMVPFEEPVSTIHNSSTTPCMSESIPPRFLFTSFFTIMTAPRLMGSFRFAQCQCAPLLLMSIDVIVFYRPSEPDDLASENMPGISQEVFLFRVGASTSFAPAETASERFDKASGSPGLMQSTVWKVSTAASRSPSSHWMTPRLFRASVL